MSLVSDLNQLSPPIKNFLISMSCLMPFWYICIYLFNPFLFSHSKLDLLIPLTFCFSLLWYLISFVLNGAVDLFVTSVFKVNEEEIDDLVIIGGLDSIIYLCIAIVIGYYSQSKYIECGLHYHFKSFLWVSFWLACVRAVILTIGGIVVHKALANTPKA